MNLLPRRLVRRATTVAAAAAVAVPLAALPMTEASASVPAISATAFGMHYLNTADPFPSVSFGSARIWDMGVRWDEMQPQSTSPLSAANPVVQRLDTIVNMFRSRHVDPILTLGQTPSWAAHACNHYRYNQEWGPQTCAPAATGATSPWGKYVTFLAQRYKGKITYFELWNEPSLANGYNDSIATLAKMQATAYSIFHRYGERLITPSVPFTNGSPTGGYNWLRSFLSSSGGKSYDVLGVHLYPSDAAAKGGYGPEWSINTALAYAKRAVSAAHAPNRPIWDTEHNVGRKPAGTGYGDSGTGAAMVARTFVLQTEANIARTFWYAADDRTWGGTFLQKQDHHSLTPAGQAERTARSMLVGKAPLGCSQPSGTKRGVYTCRFGTTTGHKTLMVVWTTAGAFTYRAPSGTKGYYSVTGGHGSASKGKAFRITGTPVYITGSF